MANESFQFKTNINCSGCIASVRPHLDNASGIIHWEVDTSNPDKTLKVETDGMDADQVAEIIRTAGFKAEVQTSNE